MAPQAAVVSYRLGGTDGVSVEAGSGRGRSVSSDSRCGASPARSTMPALRTTSWCLGSRFDDAEWTAQSILPRSPARSRTPSTAPIWSSSRTSARCRSTSTPRTRSTRAVESTRARRAVAPPRPALATTAPCVVGERVPAARARRVARDRQPALPARARRRAASTRRTRSTTTSISTPRAATATRRARSSASATTSSCSSIRRGRSSARTCPAACASRRASAELTGRNVQLWLSGPAEDGLRRHAGTRRRTLRRARHHRSRRNRRGCLRGVRRRRVPVDVGGVRQPDDRVDRGAAPVRGVPVPGAGGDPRVGRAALLDRAARHARALPRRTPMKRREHVLRREPAPGAPVVLARRPARARSTRRSPRTAGPRGDDEDPVLATAGTDRAIWSALGKRVGYTALARRDRRVLRRRRDGVPRWTVVRQHRRARRRVRHAAAPDRARLRRARGR